MTSLLFGLLACIKPPGPGFNYVNMDNFRSRNDVPCVDIILIEPGNQLLNAFSRVEIESCLQLGSPGTLYDNPDEFMLVSKFTCWDIHSCDPSRYQFTVLQNGQGIMQERGTKDVPNGTVTGTTTVWTNADIKSLPVKPAINDVFTIEIIDIHNVDKTNFGKIEVSNR